MAGVKMKTCSKISGKTRAYLHQLCWQWFASASNSSFGHELPYSAAVAVQLCCSRRCCALHRSLSPLASSPVRSQAFLKLSPNRRGFFRLRRTSGPELLRRRQPLFCRNFISVLGWPCLTSRTTSFWIFFYFLISFIIIFAYLLYEICTRRHDLKLIAVAFAASFNLGGEERWQTPNVWRAKKITPWRILLEGFWQKYVTVISILCNQRQT